MQLEEVLRIAKRFIYDELGADYGTVRPTEAVLDENTSKWKITCQYQYSPSILSTPESRVVELEMNNISGVIDSFKQVKG